MTLTWCDSAIKLRDVSKKMTGYSQCSDFLTLWIQTLKSKIKPLSSVFSKVR